MTKVMMPRPALQGCAGRRLLHRPCRPCLPRDSPPSSLRSSPSSATRPACPGWCQRCRKRGVCRCLYANVAGRSARRQRLLACRQSLERREGRFEIGDRPRALGTDPKRPGTVARDLEVLAGRRGMTEGASEVAGHGCSIQTQTIYTYSSWGVRHSPLIVRKLVSGGEETRTSADATPRTG